MTNQNCHHGQKAHSQTWLLHAAEYSTNDTLTYLLNINLFVNWRYWVRK